MRISIHALLAESDLPSEVSTSSTIAFLSTLSLRRATVWRLIFFQKYAISIHALLAESDNIFMSKPFRTGLFLSTLSLRRATQSRAAPRRRPSHFYPRSPCGERPTSSSFTIPPIIFLSTLSLRRATWAFRLRLRISNISIHALLAESDPFSTVAAALLEISIHALLAESDKRKKTHIPPKSISIHALLAESDYLSIIHILRNANFYPRSPCGERPSHLPLVSGVTHISIHALLAESDDGISAINRPNRHFYPRSPCGERPQSRAAPRRTSSHFYPRSPCGERLIPQLDNSVVKIISIHALLAESDLLYFFRYILNRKFLSTLSLRRATC